MGGTTNGIKRERGLLQFNVVFMKNINQNNNIEPAQQVRKAKTTIVTPRTASSASTGTIAMAIVTYYHVWLSRMNFKVMDICQFNTNTGLTIVFMFWYQ